MTGPAGTPALVPGPIDRVHFLDEQRRNRRASWRFSVFAVVAVALSGLPLCILISPLLFGLTMIVVHAVDLVAPIPDDVWTALEQIARAIPHSWDSLRGRGTSVSWTVLIAALVLPGAILMLAVWLWIRVMFRHAGAGGVLHRLHARAPRTDVLEELQIINIVEEMSIAAGIPPPRVMLIDSAAANAAAVGLTLDDATILVSRGLLDIDREARQAILGHVIGSVGNGDLKIASTILSVFQTWGLLALVIDTPFGHRSRRAIHDFVTVSLRPRRNARDRLTVSRMLDRLMDGAGMTFEDLTDRLDLAEGPRRPSRAVFVDLPLLVFVGPAAIASKAAIALFTLLVFGPWVALLWRARRRLADATAVQLTRNPTALARAVQDMESRTVAVEGGAPVSFLFPFWTRWAPDAPPRDDVMAHVVGTQLDLDDRLRLLMKLGASPSAVPAPADRASWKGWMVFCGWTILAVALVGACIAVTLLTTSLFLWAVWTVLAFVFGGVPR
jgi:Zn-dependent protease with chaperone function